MLQEPSAPSKSPGPSPAFLWLRASDQRFLGAVMLLLTLVLGVQFGRTNGWLRFRPAAVALTPATYRFTLEINSAAWTEWAQLDGIGETLARRIVQDRDDRGPFTSIDDVSRVKGIGDKTMEKLRPHLTLRDEKTN
ncbi:MAG: helix-hairpin-helix domain-containing protein [Planctomycetaceae bacterium]